MLKFNNRSYRTTLLKSSCVFVTNFLRICSNVGFAKLEHAFAQPFLLTLVFRNPCWKQSDADEINNLTLLAHHVSMVLRRKQLIQAVQESVRLKMKSKDSAYKIADFEYCWSILENQPSSLLVNKFGLMLSVNFKFQQFRM